MTEHTPPPTPRRRTQSERIATLEQRRIYLIRKRDERKAADKPSSYFTEEIEALDWALPLLTAERDRHGEDG